MKKIILSILMGWFLLSNAFASYEEALELFQQKKYSKSLKLIADELKVADDMVPGSPNYKLRYLAAHDHWKLGNYDSAIAHFKRCMDIKKDETGPVIDISLLLLENRRFKDAEQFARRALRKEKNAISYYVIGEAAYGIKNYCRAKQFFEKALSIAPDMYIAYNGLGRSLVSLKKYSLATTAFSAAHEMKPRSAEILNNLAFSLEMVGKQKEALQYYKSALKLEPENEIIKANINRLEK